MAAIPPVPYTMRDCVMTIKDGVTAVGDYQATMQKIELNPTTPVTQEAGLTPSAVFSEAGITAWTLDLSAFQDWATANSFSMYTFQNPGKKVTVEFTPKAGGKKATCDIILVPVKIGGTGGSGFAKSDASFPVIGQPTLV